VEKAPDTYRTGDGMDVVAKRKTLALPGIDPLILLRLVRVYIWFIDIVNLRHEYRAQIGGGLSSWSNFR
jgi:hypothetical protein